MKLFGKLKLDDNTGESEITRHNNFQSFPRALMVLFRSATGESWQQIMISIQSAPKPNCDPASKPPAKDRVTSDEDCSSWVAIPYFVSFVCLCSFLVSILNSFERYAVIFFIHLNPFRLLTCSLPSSWTISII